MSIKFDMRRFDIRGIILVRYNMDPQKNQPDNYNKLLIGLLGQIPGFSLPSVALQEGGFFYG